MNWTKSNKRCRERTVFSLVFDVVEVLLLFIFAVVCLFYLESWAIKPLCEIPRKTSETFSALPKTDCFVSDKHGLLKR